MLNLEYLQNGELNVESVKTEQKGKKPLKKGRRIVHAVCYDILACILDMQQEQIRFQKKIEGMRHNHVRRSQRYDPNAEVQKIQGDFYDITNLATPYRIERITGIPRNTIGNYVMLLKRIKLLDYNEKSKSYKVNNKGIEYMVVYEQMEKLFPFKDYTQIYHPDQ